MDIAGMVILSIIFLWSTVSMAESMLDHEPLDALLPGLFMFLSFWGIAALWEYIFPAVSS